MKRNSVLYGILVVALVLAALPLSSEAMPAFARKYGYNCTMCHSSYPRLNDYGDRYRQNGYQLPGREAEDKTILESPPPFAIRLSGGYTSITRKNIPGGLDTKGFVMNGVDVLSAGLLSENIGYFVALLPEIKESRGVEGQSGTLESGNVIFYNIGSPWVNVRVGRFEPASTAFSVKRKLTISPYEIYSFGAPGCVTFSDTQDGIELSGQGSGIGYALGYLNGSESNRSGDSPADVYARASLVLGAGEGQTAGQRLGVVGYIGRARPDGTGIQGDRQDFRRFGVDASLNLRQFNLAAQYLIGNDDRRLWNVADDVSFTGGLFELSYVPRTSVVGFARYDFVNTPSVIDRDVMRWTCGLRYYFVDNLSLHLEYSQRQENQPDESDAKEDLVAARIDFAF